MIAGEGYVNLFFRPHEREREFLNDKRENGNTRVRVKVRIMM